MGLVTFAKGQFAKSFLNHLKDGDKGSTMLGGAAAAVLAANINFSALFDSSKADQQAVEVGKLAGAIALFLWGKWVGRKNKPSVPPVDPAYLRRGSDTEL